MEILLAHGADPNLVYYDGTTPIHHAARTGQLAAVMLLLAKGAEVNAKDKQGWTPLQYAIKEDKKDTAEALTKHGGIL